MFNGLTLESALKGIQIFRNRNLVRILYDLNLIENYALGLERIFSTYKGKEEKTIIEDLSISFKVTLPNMYYKSSIINDSSNILENITKNVGENVGENIFLSLSKTDNKVLSQIILNPSISAEEISKRISLTKRTVERSIKKLKDKNIIFRIGPDKGGYWKVVRK